MSRICFVAAAEVSIVAFMVPHLRRLQQHFDITVICTTDRADFLTSRGITAHVISLPIARKISINDDIKALLALIRIFRAEGFDAVHSITPKAGLLSMLAACLSGIPVRVHCFTGQVWVTRRNWSRRFLKLMDTVTARCATDLLTDSTSQKGFLIREGVVKEEKISVLANGSVSGVDVARFVSDAGKRSQVRHRFNLPDEAFVFLFMGRLNRDKGVLDLAAAFSRLQPLHENCFLMVAGTDEEGMREQMISGMGGAAAFVRFIDHSDCPEEIMAAADVLCLPSYREGFGVVIIEAAAAGIPSLASRIYGITDAVLEGETGLLHEPGDRNDLLDKMTLLVADRVRWKIMGEAARSRAVNHFSQERVVQAMEDYYSRFRLEEKREGCV